ncbi:hypothetical protein HDU88_005364 [Geranomyces variabilis]|nr:hypothetical protein HDU88_005364 [Geranomyces variabilis]
MLNDDVRASIVRALFLAADHGRRTHALAELAVASRQWNRAVRIFCSGNNSLHRLFRLRRFSPTSLQDGPEAQDLLRRCRAERLSGTTRVAFEVSGPYFDDRYCPDADWHALFRELGTAVTSLRFDSDNPRVGRVLDAASLFFPALQSLRICAVGNFRAVELPETDIPQSPFELVDGTSLSLRDYRGYSFEIFETALKRWKESNGGLRRLGILGSPIPDADRPKLALSDAGAEHEPYRCLKDSYFKLIMAYCPRIELIDACLDEEELSEYPVDVDNYWALSLPVWTEFWNTAGTHMTEFNWIVAMDVSDEYLKAFGETPKPALVKMTFTRANYMDTPEDCITATGFRQAIRACPNLRHLSFTSTWQNDVGYDAMKTLDDAAVRELARCCPLLKTLNFYEVVDDGAIPTWFDDWTDVFLDSLAPLEHLEELCAPYGTHFTTAGIIRFMTSRPASVREWNWMIASSTRRPHLHEVMALFADITRAPAGTFSTMGPSWCVMMPIMQKGLDMPQFDTPAWRTDLKNAILVCAEEALEKHADDIGIYFLEEHDSVYITSLDGFIPPDRWAGWTLE